MAGAIVRRLLFQTVLITLIGKISMSRVDQCTMLLDGQKVGRDEKTTIAS